MSKSTKTILRPPRGHMLLFFIGCILYMELLIQLLTGWSMHGAQVCIAALFSICYGAVLAAIAQLLCAWRGKRAVMCSLLALLGLLFITMYFLRISYQTYMDLDDIFTGGGNVATEFGGTVASLLLHRFWVIVLFQLPTVLYALFGKKRCPFHAQAVVRALLCAVTAAAAFGLALLVVSRSMNMERYREKYSFDTACRSFGILTGVRLDLRYANNAPELSFQTVTPEPVEAPTEEAPPEEPETEDPVEIFSHSMDIDFAALAQQETDSEIASLHAYVASLRPEHSNEYTGLFEGKNLIFITAESLTKEAIDPELTPTLYRMANQGIVFDDYYQPAWGGSTSTGEFSNLLSLIPTNGVQSMLDTVGYNLYFTPGNQLQRLGYFSAAYHNGTYQFYDRDQTHCNLGYSTWMALGNGMEDGVQELWPESDLEMIDFTVPQFIDKQPFSIYYMSVSGHCKYDTGNDMSDKNYDAVKDLDRPEAIKCYLAANLELEHAMTSLLWQLEDAGIMDDTVIVIGPDHYPYGLEKSETWGNTKNYLTDLYGFVPETHPEHDHSALIIWSGCLETMDKIEVKTPVCSLDIVPTLSNLFGLDYDSRLLVGRDALSLSQPLVVWPDYSWLTDKGYYSASSETFTPRDGADVTSAYVERIKSIVANKFAFSRGVLNHDYYGILFGEDDVE